MRVKKDSKNPYVLPQGPPVYLPESLPIRLIITMTTLSGDACLVRVLLPKRLAMIHLLMQRRLHALSSSNHSQPLIIPTLQKSHSIIIRLALDLSKRNLLVYCFH